MTKQKVFILIPLAIIIGFLIYSWFTFLFTDLLATWRHYLAVGLFAIVIFLFFKNPAKAIIATIIYLLIGTSNLLALTPSITSGSYGLKIGPAEIWTPAFQPLSFGILILFCILNFDSLVNIYLDYKEAKNLKKK
ncbi:MAG: hypothetical protein ABUT20_39790 [Bacteroidota bacterium]